MTERHQIVPVVLSGGSGTRLWPVSRSGKPKQLLSLTHSETMLQLTLQRTKAHDTFGTPIVVANTGHADEIERQLLSVGIDEFTLILEPAARNTAPAIALAALCAKPDDLLLVMPSDHVIADLPNFHAAILRGVDPVLQGWFATFGISPSAPETGYGYIRRGDEIVPGVARVDKFVEKPDVATAQAYLDEGCYSWNGGIFLFKASSYIEALEKYAPDILKAARDAVEHGRVDGRRMFPESVAFGASPSDSIDYAVMEKADRVAVIPVEMGWSDVGSWDALHEIALKDSDGNVGHGEVMTIDTANCMVRSEGPLVAAIGVKDLIVIATGDAVLVMPRGDSQQVKKAIENLKISQHITLDRPFVYPAGL